MILGKKLKTGLAASLFSAVVALSSVPTQSQNHQVFINGQAMHPAVVGYIQQVTGVFLPGGAYFWDGQYLYDSYGNSLRLSLSATGPFQHPNGPVSQTYTGGSG